MFRRAHSHREKRRSSTSSRVATEGKWQIFRFAVLVGFLVVCLLGGGASRADVLSLLYLRPVAILCLVALLLSPGRWEFRRFRAPFLLLGLLAALMALQLVPLPPGLWLTLAGHGRFAEAATAAGFVQPWRPLSLTPDLTLNSLLALLPCLVVLVGFAGIREDQRQIFLPLMIGLVAADAFWSVLQFASGPASPTYLYAITSPDTPVGLFSNRNHHATLLALGFPILGAWVSMPARNRQRQTTRLFIAAAIGLFLIPMILASGSRAGIILGAVGLAAAYLFAMGAIAPGMRPRWRIALRLAVWLLPLGLVALTIFTNRAVSIERATSQSLAASDTRFEALPTILNMVRDFFPLGTGFGSFDPAYRIFEPDAALSSSYLNHAHNDLAELALTGGVPALVLLALFLLWFLRRTIKAYAPPWKASPATALARLGAMIVLFLLGASLVDYPLRTPLLSSVFAIACCWLTAPRRDADQPQAASAPASARSRNMGLWIGRSLAALLAAALLGWVALGVTAAQTLGRLRPDIVLSWWPYDSALQATSATLVIRDSQTRQAVADAQAQARSALEREPISVDAARTLGILAALQGQQGRAERLMAYAESLSRRDLATQLWLIESNVQRNNIGGALLHYDRALRTSSIAGEMLFPVLIQAAPNEDVMRPIANMLAGRPIWWMSFTGPFIAQSRSPAAIETIISAIRLDPNDPIEGDLLRSAIARLITLGDVPRARHLYVQAMRVPDASVPALRNGDFEAANRMPPFDWALTEQNDLSAIIQAPESGGPGHVLSIVARNGLSGEVARQLLMLPAGRYRLGAIVGAVSGSQTERPRMVVVCAASGAPIADARLPESPASGRPIAADFQVPGAACPTQWLLIQATAPLDGEPPPIWIDRVSIVPLH